MGTVLIPKKLVATSTPRVVRLAASSASVGIAARAAVYEAAAVSIWAATRALLALVAPSQARYGRCAAAYRSALGPSHAAACTVPISVVNSVAAEEYSVLNEVHAPAAASS